MSIISQKNVKIEKHPSFIKGYVTETFLKSSLSITNVNVKSKTNGP